MTNVRLLVEAELTKTNGLFIGQSDLAEALQDLIEDPGEVDVDDSNYVVDQFNVSVLGEEMRPAAKKRAVVEAMQIATGLSDLGGQAYSRLVDLLVQRGLEITTR